jgi:two-component system aerobic respiration control sensor histidine kinase ArcB
MGYISKHLKALRQRGCKTTIDASKDLPEPKKAVVHAPPLSSLIHEHGDVDAIALLRKRVRDLEVVIDEVPGNLYWKDLDGRFLGCNHNVVKVLSQIPLLEGVKMESPKDLVGKTNYDVFEPSLAATLSENDAFVLKNEEEIVFTESHKDSQGDECYWLSRKAPHYDKAGNLIGMIGSAHNITTQKKLEAQLEVALKKASSDIKAKDIFIDSLIHDVRTPLAGIIGMITILKEQVKGPHEALKNIDALHASAEAFLRFFNEVLQTVESVDEKDVKNAEVLVNLSSFQQEFMDLYQPAAREKQLTLQIHVDPGLPAMVTMRKAIVSRILTNLIGNAIKFTPSGSITVHIREADFVGHIAFEVEDTGIGIAKQDLSTIFQRFSRLNPHKQRYAGVGLGLFMVKKYVDAVGGELKVQSELGIGTRFQVVMPVKYSHKNTRVVSASNALKLSPEEYELCKTLSPKRIFILEDNEVAAMALEYMLHSFNHQTVVTTTGAEALARLQQERFDMLFIDHDLPDMNGEEVLLALRRIPGYQDTPAFLLTGYISEKIHRTFLHAPLQGIFQKPMQKEKLIRTLNKYFFESEVS